MAVNTEFRFRPAFRALPYAAAALGVGLVALVPILGLQGSTAILAIAGGLVGPLLGVMYLLAPAWRLRVVADDEGVSVYHRETLRFRIAYDEVKRLVVAPSSHTCYLDGGDADHSLLVSGPGAPAPYRIERQEELVRLLVERVPKDRQQEVSRLDEKVSPPRSTPV